MRQEPSSAFKSPAPAEVSALLPGYEVSDLIASGGMGAVYLARQESLDREVAVKILPRELGSDPNFRASFKSEARAMARLRHRNLIGVHDFGEAGGFLYIVMDFVKGKSLFHSAHGKMIDQAEAARLMQAICEGVAHAHEEGIIHRDLKPANILLNSQKQPHIGDFGLARPLNAEAGEGMHFGTPDYTAPELMVDPSKASKQSDIFALGVMLFELLTGELPGPQFVPPSQLQEVNSGFDKILRRAMHPAPAMRYPDAAEMARDLEKLQSTLSKRASNLLVTAPAKASPGSAKAKRDPAPAALALAGASSGDHRKALARNLTIIGVLLVTILIGWMTYNRKKDHQAKEQEKEDKELAEQKSADPQAAPPDEVPTRSPRSDLPPTPMPERRVLSLSDLQDSLRGGSRHRFPEGTVELGEIMIFLVNKPLNWREARKFAEEYGGHLATIVDESAKTTIVSHLPERGTVWLGGGTTGPGTWGWVDGTPWGLAEPSNSSGRYLALQSDGTVIAKPGKTRHPFFIQWHLSGKNSGTVDSQLQRLKKSLGDPKPRYPPGVLSYQERRYWIGEQEVSWDDAVELARKAGGHLVVPSEESENTYLMKALRDILPEAGSAWIGGRYQQGAWIWISGEPWSFTAWPPKPLHLLDPDHTALRILGGREGGWDNVDPEEGGASFFVVEWSKDRLAGGVAAPGVPPLNLAELKERTSQTIAKKREKHAKFILENGTAMHRELGNWLTNGIHRRARARYARVVQMAQRKLLAGGRIDEENDFPTLPADIGGKCNEYLQKQRQFDAQIAKSVDLDRQSYFKVITDRLKLAQTQRLLGEFSVLEEELEAVGQDAESFEHYLSAEEDE